MKVVYCVKYGSHEDLEVREIDPPGAPEEGQVKVDVQLAAQEVRLVEKA